MPFPVDYSFIVLAEEKLGVKFPVSFHVGMTKLNGGEISIDDEGWQLFPIFDSSDKKRLKRSVNDIVRETAYSRTRTRFPSEAIAIADNACGDLAILLPSDEDASVLRDVVYWWCHETGDIEILVPDIETWMNQRWIAPRKAGT